jgi:hypothetical protein
MATGTDRVISAIEMRRGFMVSEGDWLVLIGH